MHIDVHVAEEHLRGIPFKRYSSVLGDLIGQGFNPDDWDIRQGPLTTVTVDDRIDGDDVDEILTMVMSLTDEVGIDGFFG